MSDVNKTYPICPTYSGGRDWPMGSYNPKMNVMFMPLYNSCVDSKALDGAFAGREWDAALLAELPLAVDPCGENGEFHTFCYAGPMFRRPIAVEGGELRTFGQFVYADLR